MKIGCIIQARTGSKRFPSKILQKIDNNKNILDYVIEQTKFCKSINQIIIATTQNDEDKIINEICKKHNLKCFMGNENDLVDRYYQCAKNFNLDVIVRVTGDNPLNDPEIIDKLVLEFVKRDVDFATNEKIRTYPQGIFCQIFRFKTLEDVWKNAKLPSEREHVSPYIHNNFHKFSIYSLEFEQNLSNIRVTVDRENDLKMVKAIIKRIRKRPIHFQDILRAYNENPELSNINKNHILDEGYKISLIEDKKFLNN